MENKKISILGVTGSIGLQALDVIELLPDKFELNYITTNTNISKLETICHKFRPKGVVIADFESYKSFKATTKFEGEIFFGNTALTDIASDRSNDLLLSALVGFAGVLPTYHAVGNGINVALANKETLVSAGSIIMKTASDNNSKIFAVDSEHNAILQCLTGESKHSIEKIILTASGGPFRNTSIDEFVNITIKQALNHPNWSMGSKITIDSATMMNKGFEVIEAFWLFDLTQDQIEVVIHPQSIIHSLVQFCDGSVKAQLGMPDMRMPISYALNYPDRFFFDFPRINLTEIGRLEFYEPDMLRYPCLDLAYQAIEQGGNSTAVLNAANEVCVDAFLRERIKFVQISEIIDTVLNTIEFIENPNLDEIVNTDSESRELTFSIINNINK